MTPFRDYPEFLEFSIEQIDDKIAVLNISDKQVLTFTKSKFLTMLVDKALKFYVSPLPEGIH